MQPHHRAGRCRVHVHRTGQADGTALLHEHLWGAVDVGLGRCVRQKHKSKQTIMSQTRPYFIIYIILWLALRRVYDTVLVELSREKQYYLIFFIHLIYVSDLEIFT